MNSQTIMGFQAGSKIVLVFFLAGVGPISNCDADQEIIKDGGNVYIVESGPKMNAEKTKPANDSMTKLTTRVTVNGTTLDAQTIKFLETQYRTRLQKGDFWYDSISGLWGVVGGPAFGRIMPGLTLGGRLKHGASGGQTNIVINGRAIHPIEYQAIVATYGYAVPGRYWLDAQGNLGLEGRPFLFNIYVTAGGNAGKSWYHSSTAGWMSGNGSCVGYTAPGGESFLSGC